MTVFTVKGRMINYKISNLKVINNKKKNHTIFIILKNYGEKFKSLLST